MSNCDKKIVGNNWLELSDLTIFEAAFWMQTGDDPQYLEDAKIFEGFPDIEASLNDYNPNWTYDVYETGEVVASAARAGLIKVTADIRNGEKFDFKRTRINKSDWLDWCRNIGYVSLADSFTPTSSNSKGKSFPNKTPSSSDWKAQAREIADECFDHDTNAKPTVRDSLARKNSVGQITGGYCFRVMGIMQERDIKGPRGIITNPATIMREALQGKKWWANKSK